jgi:flagellar protein FliO/FliZ
VIELVLRIGFSLLVVLGLMWMLAKLARRRPLGGRGGATLTVLARQQLSRSASVTIVQVADRALVLGVTDGQISLLAEADPAALRQPAAEPVERRDAVRLDAPVAPALSSSPPRLAGSVLSPATWRQTVEFLRERTARR